jgi:CRISPR-associated protein Cas2
MASTPAPLDPSLRAPPVSLPSSPSASATPSWKPGAACCTDPPLAAVRTRYVIAYDIQDDRRRTRLAELLLDAGDRVQQSVFEALLTPDELQELLARAAKYVGDEDSLRAYPVCAACAAKIAVVGRAAVVGSPGMVLV